ncbi:hypothetical protein [Lacrimispora sp.]|uniref:hypothetical protein n=1 Tax=Lacrimispora sp. TaxID=2719234 RepID=UPI0034613C8E
MNRIKMIEKIIGEAIVSYGFRVEYTDEEGVDFIRERGDLKQFIYVYIENNLLLLKYKTNTYRQLSVNEANLFLPEESFAYGIFDFPMPASPWVWNDEEEFVDILNTFKNEILTDGLRELQELSEVHFPEAMVQTNRELYENHKELDLRYRNLLKIDHSTPTLLVVDTIREEILKIRDYNFEEVRPILIGLAAIYAEELVVHREEWQWEFDNKSCWISTKGGRIGGRYRRTYPLNEIIGYWSYNDNDINDEFFLDEFLDC